MIRFLVRKLTILDNEGKETVFPLVVISATKTESVLTDIHIYNFETETEHTEYLNDLTLEDLGDGSCKIIRFQS